MFCVTAKKKEAKVGQAFVKKLSYAQGFLRCELRKTKNLINLMFWLANLA